MCFMIRSMTGFGSASKTKDGLTAAVELKSVNYRFKEVNARMPRPLLYLEDKIKQTIFKHIQRGRLELFVSVDDEALVTRKIQVDWPLLEEYQKAAREMKDRCGFLETSRFKTPFSLSMSSKLKKSQSKMTSLKRFFWKRSRLPF